MFPSSPMEITAFYFVRSNTLDSILSLKIILNYNNSDQGIGFKFVDSLFLIPIVLTNNNNKLEDFIKLSNKLIEYF